MDLRQVEQGFSSFFAKFLAYLMIFQSGAQERLSAKSLKNHQIWQKKIAKNEEKPCSTCLKPHLSIPKPKNPDFG